MQVAICLKTTKKITTNSLNKQRLEKIHVIRASLSQIE